MKILFGALRNSDYRNLDSVVEKLAARGHDIFLGAEWPDSAFGGGQPIVDRLTRAYPNVTSGRIASREPDSLFIASKIRLACDYLRYLHPMFPARHGIRPMARERTPTAIVRACRSRMLNNEPARSVLRRVLDRIDRATPPSPAIEEFLDHQRPDAVVITPLIGLAPTSQLDLLRSALARHIPTAVMVWSWDNLSTKSIIRDAPDALLVWNETQKREAMQMHHMPADRIVITGAQNLDKWFGRRPSRCRAGFVRDAGLTDERPYAMWVCSALLPISPPEPDVVLHWAAKIRESSDPRVRDVPILIRPHPARMSEWDGVDWRQFGNITMFGRTPVDEPSRNDFFDSMYYAGAVVGVTTTAFLDAAVVGRPVMSFYDEALRYEHEDAVHFQYLLNVEGGLLTMAQSVDEHVRQLAMMLAGQPPDVLERQQRFVEAFVRPCGIDVPATEIVVNELERLKSRRSRLPSPTLLGRLGLQFVQALERHPALRTLVLDPREAETYARQMDKARHREEALARKAQQRAEKYERATARERTKPKKNGVRPGA